MKPKAFKFVSFEFKPSKKRADFCYQIEFFDSRPLFFTETLILPEIPKVKKEERQVLNNLLRDVHLILGISYYKAYCPPKIKLNYSLSKKEAQFWQEAYLKGLGEFFYRNKLDPQKLAKFFFSEKTKTPSAQSLKRKPRILLGLGGGKDSLVALELLKQQELELTSLIIETQRRQKVQEQIVKKSGVPSLKIRRILDEKLIKGLPESFNGHVPVSAIYAFLGLLTAVLYDYSYIAVGNEYSSDFGNLKYKGLVINHQWSKSSEFEKLFRNYVWEFITPSITYFSLLRPFFEIRVVKMFAELGQKYFPYFSSCNKNFRVKEFLRNDSLWCGQCPKCVFVFTLMAAFLPKAEILKVFKKNLFADEKLLPLFRDLLGFGGLKPFDCVGTPEEMQAAFYLASRKHQGCVFSEFLPKIKRPGLLVKEVLQTNRALTVPSRFRFLGMKNALLLGYGKEGQATKKYLRKNYPRLKLTIADQKQEPSYLKKQETSDIVIKTPGIPKHLVNKQYTTATNIFFSRVNNKIIGVTGSKGKSTTASLIHRILKEGGVKTRLLGNIGKPMLEALGKIKPEEVIVLELSSYQLDDIEFSPQIAVVTNLFPEHLNYHGNAENYYQAKKNIIKFQTEKDVFVYNGRDEKLSDWSKNSKAKAVPFTAKLPVKKQEISLIGNHNLENIRAAATVAKLSGVSDSKAKSAIKKFKGLPHRLESVGEFRGIKFYDDAISTAPESTMAAIEALSKEAKIGTIFLGGEDRGYDFRKLEKVIKDTKIKNIVLFPDSGRRIFKKEKNLNILRTTSLEKAVKFAYKFTPRGSICLLSTASPSYSLWKNFEEKGDLFQGFVKEQGS